MYDNLIEKSDKILKIGMTKKIKYIEMQYRDNLIDALMT